MDDLPPSTHTSATPNHGSQPSHHSHHNNLNRKYPQQAQQQYKVSYSLLLNNSNHNNPHHTTNKYHRNNKYHHNSISTHHLNKNTINKHLVILVPPQGGYQQPYLNVLHSNNIVARHPSMQYQQRPSSASPPAQNKYINNTHHHNQVRLRNISHKLQIMDIIQSITFQRLVGNHQDHCNHFKIRERIEIS